MALARVQTDSISKELVEELLKFSNIADQLQSLTKHLILTSNYSNAIVICKETIYG